MLMMTKMATTVHTALTTPFVFLLNSIGMSIL